MPRQSIEVEVVTFWASRLDTHVMFKMQHKAETMRTTLVNVPDRHVTVKRVMDAN